MRRTEFVAGHRPSSARAAAGLRGGAGHTLGLGALQAPSVRGRPAQVAGQWAEVGVQRATNSSLFPQAEVVSEVGEEPPVGPVRRLRLGRHADDRRLAGEQDRAARARGNGAAQVGQQVEVQLAAEVVHAEDA
jgi:hypothetical protein